MTTNIFFVSQYFLPEVCAPAVRAADLAREWSRAGTNVTILTGFPNHPEGVLHPEYRKLWRKGLVHEDFEGTRVIRTWLYPAANRGWCGRAANYISFALSAAATGPFLVPSNSVVIGSSPQLLVALSAYLTARAHRRPFIFEVRDLWPESMIAVGAATDRKSLVYRSLEKVAHFLYRRADHITVDGDWKKRTLLSYGVPEQKVSTIINGVADDFFPDPVSAAARASRAKLRQELGLEKKFVALYCGTLGMAHGLETILLAADRLRNRSEVVFVLMGEGADREHLVARSRDLRLPNLMLLGKQPRSKVGAYLAAADACIVPLRRSETFKTAIPSKMFEAMAAGKPVLLGVEGEAQELLLNANAGIAFVPEDSADLADKVLGLARQPDMARQLGANGRKAIIEKYSRRRQALAYLKLIQELAVSRYPAPQPAAAPVPDRAAIGRGLGAR